jgi:hypothetical protein
MNSSTTIDKSHSRTSESAEKGNPRELKQPDLGTEHEEHGHGVEWAELVRIAFVALAAGVVWFRFWEPFPHLSVIGIVLVAICLISRSATITFFAVTSTSGVFSSLPLM